VRASSEQFQVARAERCLSAAKAGRVEYLRWRKLLWLPIEPPEFDAVKVVVATEPQHHFTELVRAQIVGVGPFGLYRANVNTSEVVKDLLVLSVMRDG